MRGDVAATGLPEEELLSRATTAADVLGAALLSVDCAACSSQAGYSPRVVLQTSLRPALGTTETWLQVSAVALRAVCVMHCMF